MNYINKILTIYIYIYINDTKITLAWFSPGLNVKMFKCKQIFQTEKTTTKQ